MKQISLPTNQNQTHGQGEQTCGCQGGGSGMDWEFGVSRCKRLHLEWISRSSYCGEVEMNPTGNHEVAGLIPSLAQWVKDLVWP